MDGKQLFGQHYSWACAVMGRTWRAALVCVVGSAREPGAWQGGGGGARHRVARLLIARLQGEVLGITRFGIAKMKDSVLHTAR
jgi:hypothetical protein